MWLNRGIGGGGEERSRRQQPATRTPVVVVVCIVAALAFSGTMLFSSSAHLPKSDVGLSPVPAPVRTAAVVGKRAEGLGGDEAVGRVIRTLRERNHALESSGAEWQRSLREAAKAASEERAARERAETDLGETIAGLRAELRRARVAGANGAPAGGTDGGDGPGAAGGVAADDDADAGPPALKVYVYEMPARFTTAAAGINKDCRPSAPNSWQTKYTGEVYVHEELLRSPVRTKDPTEADLFFVPLYFGCYMHVRGTNFTRGHAFLADAQAHVAAHWPHWNKSQGRDHVVVLTHDLGACTGPFMPFRHAILVTNTGELMDRRADMEAYTSMYDPRYKRRRNLALPCFQPWKDVVVPPVINDPRLLHAKGGTSGSKERTLLASFRGTVIDGGPWKHYSRGIRQRWVKAFGQHDPDVRIASVHPNEAKNKDYALNYHRDFVTSKFCLCPPGWATWTPRLYESLLAGCVPALVSDHNVLPFARVTDFSEFSVSIPEAEAHTVKDVLSAIPSSRVAAMQAALRRVWPRFVWTLPRAVPGDAFHYLLHELKHRAKTLHGQHLPSARRRIPAAPGGKDPPGPA